MERVRIHKEIDIDSFGLITYIWGWVKWR
jgi:hypothetical protein